MRTDERGTARATAQTQTHGADDPPWLALAIERGQEFDYRGKRPLVHNAVNLSLLALLVLGLVGAGSIPLPPGLYVPVAALAFGWLYLALFTLVVHEGCHYMFVVARDRVLARRLNRIFGWIVCAPFGVDFHQHWEKGHHTHHLHPMTDEDPQACAPLVGRALHLECLAILLVPLYIQIRSARSGAGTAGGCPATRAFTRNLPLRIGAPAGWAVFFAVAIALGSWPVPLAAFLGAQVTAVLQQYKLAMEHGGALARQPVHFRSRTSRFPFVRFVLPFNLSLHFQHHLNYCVPCTTSAATKRSSGT
jgi:fatty acid desaturase